MPSKSRNLAAQINAPDTLLGASIAAPATYSPASVTAKGADTVATVNDLPTVGNALGAAKFVSGSNRLYLWNGSGWYSIALVNSSPTFDSGGQPAASYVLDADSPQDATIITLAASDPEGLPITYSHVIGGSMDSMATISQDSSVFTITPKTQAQVGADEATGTITFRATDGINILPHQSSFTLTFITTVVNSRYTSLDISVNATGANDSFTNSGSGSAPVAGSTNNATAGTFSPFRKGGYSHYFTGSGTNFAAPSTTALGTGDYTVEGWVNFEDVTSNRTILTIANTHQLFYRNGHQCMAIGGNNFTTGLPSVNTWYHFAYVRSSGDVTLYWDGQSKGTVTLNTNYTSSQLTIGAWHTPSEFFKGYLRDIKVSSTAVYSSNFSVPTEKSVSDSNTVLLTCHLPYITDGSSNNYSFTSLSNAPLAYPLGPYDYEPHALSDGGSIYFDGTGTSGTADAPIEIAAVNDGGANHTISFWYWYDSTVTSGTGTDGQLFTYGDEQGNVGYGLMHTNASNGRLVMMYGASPYETVLVTSGAKHSQWNYVQVVKTGTTVRCRLNGVLGTGSGSRSSDFSNGAAELNVGSERYGGMSRFFKGYIADLQYINSASTDYSVPTSIRSSSGTVVHLKGETGKIIDKSQAGNISLVGSAAPVGVASNKGGNWAGTFATQFSSTGANSYAYWSQNIKLYQFTVECNFKMSGIVNNMPLLTIGQATGANNGVLFGFMTSETQSSVSGHSFRIRDNTPQSIYTGYAKSPNWATGTWYNLVVTRTSAGVLRVYLDGTQMGSDVTTTDAFEGDDVTIGAENWSSAGPYAARTFQGEISDLRISNYVRYADATAVATSISSGELSEPFKG